MMARTTFSETMTGVLSSPSSRSLHPTGSPSPRLRSAHTLSAPKVPPEDSKEARTRALRAALGSGRPTAAAWSR